jgi:hypothetical protein
MEKVNGVDLAASVASAESERVATALADAKRKIGRKIDDLLGAIYNETRDIEAATKEMVASNTEYARVISLHQTELGFLESRLAAIKAGNWDALDHNFGRPEKPKPKTEITINVGGIAENVRRAMQDRYRFLEPSCRG